MVHHVMQMAHPMPTTSQHVCATKKIVCISAKKKKDKKGEVAEVSRFCGLIQNVDALL